MIRVIASVVALFLLLSSLEAWAGYWLAGRWFVSSRFASVSLGTVKQWMDRGIITPSTSTVKVFINRYGKWILLTIGLSQVISEVQDLQASSQYCYLPGYSTSAAWTSWGSLTVFHAGNNPEHFYTVSYSQSCSSGSASIPAVQIRAWLKPWNSDRYQWVEFAYVPASGTYQIGQCSVTFSLRNVGGVCPSDVYQPREEVDWNQRRQVPVRVFPNPLDFVHPDVIESDPSLRWLRDEYQRIASDNTIPLVPSDVLSGVDLPSVDWSISSEEALDSASESGSTSQDQTSDTAVNIPGFDTNLPRIEKRPFPVEIINSLVQNHPLLRIISNVHFEAGTGGSCSIGSGSFTISFCDHAWVLNLMGAIIVPIAFLIGVFGWRGD